MRKKACVLAALLLAALLSGCFGSEDLMQAPRPAVQYQDLTKQIKALLDSGYNYSAPVSGDNRQAVLMTDLLGDGRQEAVVFLRGETENLLAVFLPAGDEFTPVPPIAETAESVHSVVFADIDGDGRQEIIVGWQITGGRFISVYALEDDVLTEVFSRMFSGYTVYDIEDSGVPALLLLQIDPSNPAEQMAEMYAHRGGELVLVSSARLSRGAEAVKRILTGPLLDGRPGLYVASQYQTAAGEVTDVLTFREGSLINISANMEMGISETLVRTREIAASDIDGSGVYSLPRPVELARYPGDDENSDPFYEIRWTAYDSGGLSVETARTYHSVTNNWYILLPEQWPQPGFYTARRFVSSALQTTTFSILTEDGAAIDFLRIYYLTQPASDRQPVRDRTVLAEQDNLLVTAEIIPLKDDLARFNISESELKSLFILIPADWRGP